jgi:hypothetical protein
MYMNEKQKEQLAEILTNYKWKGTSFDNTAAALKNLFVNIGDSTSDNQGSSNYPNIKIRGQLSFDPLLPSIPFDDVPTLLTSGSWLVVGTRIINTNTQSFASAIPNLLSGNYKIKFHWLYESIKKISAITSDDDMLVINDSTLGVRAVYRRGDGHVFTRGLTLLS